MQFQADQGIWVWAEQGAADGGEATGIEMADWKQEVNFFLSCCLVFF